MLDGMRAGGLSNKRSVCHLLPLPRLKALFGFVQQSDLPPSRGPDGHYRSSAIQVEPMDDAFIGGWAMAAPGHSSSLPAQPEGNGNVGAQLGIPAPPPPAPSAHLLQTGYPFVPQTPLPPPPPPGVIHGVTPSFNQSTLSRLGPVERSEALNLKKRTMHPYLQYMCGPLLRYDTVDEHGVWYGAALIISELVALKKTCPSM